jgi:hypothetical protein
MTNVLPFPKTLSTRMFPLWVSTIHLALIRLKILILLILMQGFAFF